MIGQIEPTELARRLRTAPEELVLVDVRELPERAFAVIRPSMHVPMHEIPTRVREIPQDRDVVVYCHTGVRSAMVAAYLGTVGYPRVLNLVGGIDRWSVKVDAQVPRYL